VVSVRGQTIIPKSLRQLCHIQEGDLIHWRPHQGGLLVERLIVRPAEEEELSEQEWQALDRLVARQRKQRRLSRYPSLEQAKEHSRKLARHGR
jgi:bifunctional DNA-binding transcriptional regulator/antitoxin component of YhaV-PrlF toxin-antitoxin module